MLVPGPDRGLQRRRMPALRDATVLYCNSESLEGVAPAGAIESVADVPSTWEPHRTHHRAHTSVAPTQSLTVALLGLDHRMY